MLYFIRKIRGGIVCIQECGWYYTWHHFWGKVGRCLRARGIMKKPAEMLCAYAHELHYFRFGSLGGLDAAPQAYGDGAVSGTWRGASVGLPVRRVAVIAFYSADGRISDAQVGLVRGVSTVADRLVLCGDCLLELEEVRKLLPFASVIACERHGEYDFGSYRRGYEIARNEGWLEGEGLVDLILMNDSCYGPIYPLANAFRRMKRVSCDFWGLTAYSSRRNRHIQSYFYVFRRKTVASGAVAEFLDRVHGQKTRQAVIDAYELAFTRFLANRGFVWQTLVPFGAVPYNPTSRSLTLLEKHHVPFVKRKAILGESDEDPKLILSRIERVNRPLARVIREDCARRGVAL